MKSQDEWVDGVNKVIEEKQDLKKKEVELGQNYLRLLEENQELKQKLDETIEMLNKEINSSENAFEGLMKENQALKDTVEALQSELAHCEEDYILEEYL